MPATGVRRRRDPVAPMIDFSRNHFELFGLPERFRFDADALDRAYRELQGDVHPDRFAAASDDRSGASRCSRRPA